MRRRGYIVPPLSRQKILSKSNQCREALNLGDRKYIPIIPLLEIMHCHDILNTEICDDADVAYRGEAFYDPAEKKIIIPDSVYCAACSNQGRARFTVAHELGHFFLGHTVAFGRNDYCDDNEWRPFIDSEWQADNFAGFFLAAPHLINMHSTTNQVSIEFGLSLQAAEIAIKNAKKPGKVPGLMGTCGTGSVLNNT